MEFEKRIDGFRRDKIKQVAQGFDKKAQINGHVASP